MPDGSGAAESKVRLWHIPDSPQRVTDVRLLAKKRTNRTAVILVPL